MGHSIGGAFIRLYSAMYPDEVCGLFFIDPTDFMLTQNEDEQVKVNSSSATGYSALLVRNFDYMLVNPSISEGFRNELQREKAEVSPIFFKRYNNLHPLNDIAVTVMISYNKHIENYETDMNEKLKLGINLIAW